MIQTLLGIDIQITQAINSIIPHNTFLNYFFSFFSLQGNSILIWLFIILLLVIFEEKRDKKFIIYFLIAFLSTAFLVNIVIKNIVQRPRPVPVLANACPKDFSFPSGHAATAFAAATIIAYFDKKRRWIYYGIAVLISLSRIYLGCHFFLDVLCGAIIGYIISWLFLRKKLLTFNF